MDCIEYTFEEIPVTIGGKKYWADGTIIVNFYTERSDASVGFRGGVVISHYDCLTAELFDEDGSSISINEKDGQIVKDIADALNEDSVLADCEDYLN